jgi:hypothetical protein
MPGRPQSNIVRGLRRHHERNFGMSTFLRRLAAAATLVALALATLSIAPGSAASASCGPRQVSQPFAPWLDLGHYFLAPGGDFESTAGWTLGSGAKVVAGNETFLVNNRSDGHSLSLGAAGSARTPAMCVDSDELTMRFFARNTGSVLSTLVLEARVQTTVLGLTTQTTLPVTVVPGLARTWAPSLPVVFSLSLNQLLGGVSKIDFTFRTLGPGGAWQIDDVYVDPFKDRAPS